MSKLKLYHIDPMKFSQVYLLCPINDQTPSVFCKKGDL